MERKNRGDKNKILYIVILSLFIFVYSAYSHPHVFIDNSVIFIFGENGLKSIQLTWVFNEMFSSMVIEDYDKNKDGEFDQDELEILQIDMFSNVKDYCYFCHMTIDGKEFKVNEVVDFFAYIRDGAMVVYTFIVPCEVIAEAKYKTIVLSVYDDTYYIAVTTAKENSVQAEGIVEKNYSYKIVDTPGKSYYYGQIIPEEIIFKFKKSP